MIRRVVLLLLVAAFSTAAAKELPPQPERLDPVAMEKLVSDEMQLLDHGFRDEAERALEARIADSTDKLGAADLIESYGFELYLRAEASEDRSALESSQLYLRRAVATYQSLLDEDDPDLATALANYADAERALQPDDPAESADAAYAQAYRIRKARFGASAPISLRTLVKINELEALPSRAWSQPVATKASPKGDRAAKPVELLAPGSETPCTLETADGGMIFEGSPEAMAKLRERAEAARVHLQACGPLLALQIPPRSDAAAIASLINAVGDRQIDGVRMRLLAGNR